mmetsp:Transcript_33512/g.95344  ORF Transcript_33512/g.95344 Transcript_33512/m.95344 type:complete len:234 (+) Transcript_33512:1825-2526(+)
MQRDLGEALLLQVADHGVAAEPAVGDPHLHIVELALVQRKLEQILRAVQLLLVNHVLAVDEVHVLLVHADDVDRARQRVDDAAVAVRQAVLDMAQCRVHEDAVLIPYAALDADVLVKGVVVLQVLPCHGHVVLGHEGDILAVRRPHGVPHAARHREVVDHLAGVQVVEDHLLLALEEDPVVASWEDALCGHGGFELLRQLVLECVNADGAALLQHGEPVPGGEAHRLRAALLR